MYIALIMVSGSVKNPFSSDCINTGFFNKHHIHKQRQATPWVWTIAIWKLLAIFILHTRYHPEIIGYILKNKQKVKDIINPYTCFLKNANFSIKTSND